jgi:hypothetical protein
MMHDYDWRDCDPELLRRMELADDVLQAADGVPRPHLVAISRALLVAGPPVSGLGNAFDSLAGGSRDLARIQLAHALRRCATLPGAGELLQRLGYDQREPWIALRGALTEIADSHGVIRNPS